MAMPQVDWESIESFVQIPLSWFREVSRRSNLFSKHPLIVIDRNNPDGVGISIDATQLPKGGGGSGGAFAFDGSNISGGAVCFARQWYKVEGLSDVADGSYRIKFTIATRTAEVEAGDGFAEPTDDVCYAPLFEIADGEISADYRGGPFVAIRE